MDKKNLIYNSIENYDLSNTDFQIKFFEAVINGMHAKYKRAKELNLPMKTVEDRLKALEILKEDDRAKQVLKVRLEKRVQNEYNADLMVFSGELDHFLIDVVPVPSFLENIDKQDGVINVDQMIWNYNSYLELVDFDMYAVIKYEMDLNESYLFAEKEKSKLTKCVALSTVVRPIASFDAIDEKAEYDDYLDMLYDIDSKLFKQYKDEAEIWAQLNNEEQYFANPYVAKIVLNDMYRVYNEKQKAIFFKQKLERLKNSDDVFERLSPYFLDDLEPMDARESNRYIHKYRTLSSGEHLFKVNNIYKLPKMSLDQMMRLYIKPSFGLLEKIKTIVIQCQVTYDESVYLFYPFFKVDEKYPSSHKLIIHELDSKVNWVFFSSHRVHKVFPICYVHRIKGTYKERPRVRDFKKWVKVDLSVCVLWDTFYDKWVRVLYKFGFLFLEEGTDYLRIVPSDKLHLVLNIYELSFDIDLIMKHSSYVTLALWKEIASYMRLLNRFFLDQWDKEKLFHYESFRKNPIKFGTLMKRLMKKNDDFF